MIRIDTVFTGLPGLPGLAQLFFTGDDQAAADAAVEKVKAFYNDRSIALVDRLTCTVQSIATGMNPATGAIFDFFPVDGQAIPGLSAQEPVANATQVNLGFRTATVRRGRRVIGRSNLPGINLNALDEGQLGAAAQLAFQQALELTLGGGGGTASHVVWSRPLLDNQDPPNVIEPGVDTLVTSYNVPAKLAVLRSRRD